MTEEQKSANKAARKERDRAYRERRREYEAAMEAAVAPYPYDLAGTQVAPVTQAALEAERKFNAAMEAADAEERRVRQQIAELEARITGVRERNGVNAACAVKNAALDALRNARTSAEKEVRARFPDIAGVYSAAEWAAKKEEQS